MALSKYTKPTCPFCGGNLITKNTLKLGIGKMEIASITFRKRMICKECKSVCFKNARG